LIVILAYVSYEVMRCVFGIFLLVVNYSLPNFSIWSNFTRN